MNFEITFANGCFFKHLMDFITACVYPTNKCWLKFSKDYGIELDHQNVKAQNVNIQYYIHIILDKSNFLEYNIDKDVSIHIEPKQIQKLCKNIKKQDILKLSFSESKQDDISVYRLKLIINTQQRYEEKCIKIEVLIMKIFL